MDNNVITGGYWPGTSMGRTDMWFQPRKQDSCYYNTHPWRNKVVSGMNAANGQRHANGQQAGWGVSNMKEWLEEDVGTSLGRLLAELRSGTTAVE